MASPAHSVPTDESTAASGRRAPLAPAPGFAGQPFLGLIDSVLVPDPAAHDFDGAVTLRHAQFIWTWMGRDLAPDLIDLTTIDTRPGAREALELQLPELVQRARDAVAATEDNSELARRLRVQIGGEEVLPRLPIVLTALRCRTALEKAQAFGRAAASITDEAALMQALQSFPRDNPKVAALLMQAAIGQVNHPGRLVAAAVRNAGEDSEARLQRAGFAPLIDAIYSHAQAVIPTLTQLGPFADIDLTCRAVERFHRLIHAVSTYIELERGSRWSTLSAALIKQVSELLAPKLRDLVPDVNRALRKSREGADRLDADSVLNALNGCYVLATVRECRNSLALNSLFEETWAHVGQALEMHVQRNLDFLRADPQDRIIAARLDGAIKMVGLRFNHEYAETLRRAKDTIERRGA
ncbi:hypothetical protein [Devosia sp.]|uniref:hypothetical protein n=1 Tax=Devosia sp. TaxID=1871048 RepID=UPI003A8D07F9